MFRITDRQLEQSGACLARNVLPRLPQAVFYKQGATEPQLQTYSRLQIYIPTFKCRKVIISVSLLTCTIGSFMLLNLSGYSKSEFSFCQMRQPSRNDEYPSSTLMWAQMVNCKNLGLSLRHQFYTLHSGKESLVKFVR